ncbi:MAG: tetratricopeptide repeat protein [Candidatus Kaelpia aquatica]|nr:tetratricopeptide repeat protein [Candidatus Kaelpia aquatica]
MKFLSVFIILSTVLFNFGCSKNYRTETMIQEEAFNYQKNGRDAQDKNDWKKAISYYKKAAYLDPYNVKMHNDLAIAYERQKLYTLAEDSYKKAIEVDKDFLASYFNLGRLYEKMGIVSDAIFYYKQRVSLAKEKDDPWAWKARQRIEYYESMDLER